jgi:hypothetical protein
MASQIHWKFVDQSPLVHSDEPRSRIFKSVLMIMFLVVGVWLFNVVYTTLLARFLTDPFSTGFIAPTVSLMTVLIASTTNPPILYICR